MANETVTAFVLRIPSLLNQLPSTGIVGDSRTDRGELGCRALAEKGMETKYVSWLSAATSVPNHPG